MVKKVVLVPLLLTALAGAGGIQSIRNLYVEVNNGVEGGSYYCTEVRMNPEDKSYPAVGTFIKTIAFFWDIDPENDLTPSVFFIRINSQHAAIEEYEEFLFNPDGTLAFFFRKGGIEQIEERFYFNGSQLISYTVDGTAADDPASDHIELAEQVLQQTENLTRSFALLH